MAHLCEVESGTDDVESDSVPVDAKVFRSQLQQQVETFPVVAGVWMFFLVFEAYLWGLPAFAKWQFTMDANHTIFEDYCWTPAEHITCGVNPYTGNKTYKELVDELGLTYRYKSDGKLYGCGCGEAVFADYVCPYVPPGADFPVSFGISQYIGTAPASGAMGAVSMVPILAMWYYGSGASSAFAYLNPALASWPTKHLGLLDLLTWVTMLIFQIFYGLFLCFTWCVDHTLHRKVLYPMLFSLLFHWCFVAVGIGCKTPQAKATSGAISFLILLGLYGQIATFACNSGKPVGPVTCPVPLYESGLGFWFFEVVTLSAYFAIAPVVLTINYLQQRIA